MDSPVCCASCGALNPLPPSLFSYFELFGMEPAYDIDPQFLRRQYLSLSRSVHPDAVATTEDETRRRSLQLSSGLNRAYETLADPVRRAEYLLARAGGPDAAEDKSVPPELLGEVMMFREEIEEANESADRDTLTIIRQQVLARRERTLTEIGTICRSKDLNEQTVLKQLRLELNTIKYWNNLLEQFPADLA